MMRPSGMVSIPSGSCWASEARIEAAAKDL
jgi:hypothetical protein